MAAQEVKHRAVIVAGGALLAGIVVALLFQGPLQSFENPVTALKYAIRGPVPADSNIVLVYIDDAAVRSTGWPVRRNFYALMVRVLAELQVKAVGIEAVLEDQKAEYPEYDDLLATLAAASGRVVLSSYFSSVERGEAAGGVDSLLGPLFEYPGVHAVEYAGTGLHLPYRKLLGSSAGVGHVNLGPGPVTPVLVKSARSTVPAFALEVLRVFLGAERQALWFEHDALSFQMPGGALQFSTDRGGVEPWYPGGFGAYRAYPFLEVLRSYDAVRIGRESRIPVALFKDKIVLLAVVAEGRSQFLNAPFDPRLPSVLFHGAILDNALQNRFLSKAAGWLVCLLCSLLVAGSALCVLLLRSPYGLLLPVAFLVMVVLLSFAAFAWHGVELPLVPLVLVSAGAVGGTLAYRQRHEKRLVDRLERERESILAELRGREMKVSALEKELREAGDSRSSDRTDRLLEEIRRYKAEIHELSSRADDMEPFAGGAGEPVRDEFEGIIYGRSGKMGEVVRFISKIAESTAPVLVIGESGTGKELVARAIHRRSTRSGGPFLAVNCGALSETLLESELFGHERGSFTGAVKDKPGRFERADGGTIFLDEIGEVSEAFQLKLLRVLQEGELERVGGTETIRVDVRVIAATNRDLREEVARKRFREDLYYRLNVLTVSLPPLRERKEDIPILVDNFLAKEEGGVTASRHVMDALMAYPWRGNVRELESVLKRAVLLARADRRTMIGLRDLVEEVASSAGRRLPLEEQVLEQLRAKGFSRSSITETAAELGGLNRGTVAEHLRGECLKAFVENGCDLDRATIAVSQSSEPEVNERVRKRMVEYLAHLVEAVDRSRSWADAKTSLQGKLKNLPQRYHPWAEEVAEGYHKRRWHLPPSQS